MSGCLYPVGHRPKNLELQNVPSNLVGFILALYAFRSVTAERSRTKNDATTKKTHAYARRCR